MPFQTKSHVMSRSCCPGSEGTCSKEMTPRKFSSCIWGVHREMPFSNPHAFQDLGGTASPLDDAPKGVILARRMHNPRVGVASPCHLISRKFRIVRVEPNYPAVPSTKPVSETLTWNLPTTLSSITYLLAGLGFG